MRYGSVCSGVEAATVAWHPLGWQAAWYSEIEPFPCAVLKHHYPTVPNYGDMTQYEAWPNEPINLLVGGTPCQSFSVAGLRKGLADPRGNLMLTYGAIAKRYRPEWLVWENVPGVLSSNGGRDFGTFLGMLAELGYGFAYRVLDAQYFGVAQRRRRVFVIGHLGDWHRAAAVLFERHSLQGHPAPSRKTGQNPSTFFESSLAQYRAENIGGTLKASGGVLGGGSETFVANTLTAGIGRRNDVNSDTFAVEPIAWDGEFNPSVNVAGTLLRGGQGGRQEGVMQPIGFGAQMSIPQVDVDLMQTLQAKNPMAVAISGDIAGTLDANYYKECGSANYGEREIVAQPVTQFGEIAGSLTARHDSSPCADRGQNVVAQPVAFQSSQSGVRLAKTHATLDANNGPRRHNGVVSAMQVRRLTPVECERLQGFHDNYTNIPWRKKSESPDGPRYKAMGNSMAVPVMAWIGRRIAAVQAL
jgi:DNA (cytosine-5)-methyltransferase 1